MDKGVVHIVCLDAPSPPDYGGVYDLYYKIPALAKMGYRVILHYFDYKKQRGTEGLEPFCNAIYKYPRRTFWQGLVTPLPYIVHSRINAGLIGRLNKDAAPLIIEGIHCTGILPYVNAANRKVIVRVHNDEAVYYKELATLEKNFLKKSFLKRESRLLVNYQETLLSDVHYSFVAQSDLQHFKKKYGFNNTSFVPVFIPWTSINGKKGKGKYCLYHGNLSVSENVKAVEWLIKTVFVNSGVPLIVAGKAPLPHLINLINNNSNVQLISNPSDVEMATLVQDAHIHLLPSFNKTGVKLKLLHALFNGRFCITNNEGVDGSGVHMGVLLANRAADYKNLINEYMKKEFSSDDIKQRLYLLEIYNNDKSAQALSAFL